MLVWNKYIFKPSLEYSSIDLFMILLNFQFDRRRAALDDDDDGINYDDL